MDSTNLCNALRMEFEGIFENKIPLDAFPAKIQDMILALSRQENYSTSNPQLSSSASFLRLNVLSSLN